MATSALAHWVKSSVEYRSLLRVGETLQELSVITKEGTAMADSICAMIPDFLIIKYGVEAPPRETGMPPSRQLRLARGYEIHLFPSGNKHLLANDGSGRYLNADRTAEVGWIGPPTGSILLFTVDLANGLLDEIDLFVQSFPPPVETDA